MDIGGNNLTSKISISAIIDATCFTLSCYEVRIVRLEGCMVRATMKLSTLWDADKHHSTKVIKGISRATSSFKHLINECKVKIKELFADTSFLCPKMSNYAPIWNKVRNKAVEKRKTESKRLPSMGENIREYQTIGYSEWAKKTGYFRKRFSEELIFGMLITEYKNEITSHTERTVEKDILSRLILHNHHAFPYHRSLSQKEEA